MKQQEPFFKTVCALAIPVALQSMLQSSFSMVDQIMIGQLGEINVAGVGLAGKFASGNDFEVKSSEVKSLSRVQLFATPWTTCSLPGSSIHGIFQAIVLEWIAISFSRGSSRD